MPEVVANFTFGGAKRNRLFITATSSLYSILVNFNGARYPRRHVTDDLPRFREAGS